MSTFISEDIFLIVLYSLVFLVGTIGNINVIRVFGFTNQRKKAGSLLVTGLAFTDIISSIIIPFTEISHIYINTKLEKKWPFTDAACHFLSAAALQLPMASAFILASISIERMR